MLIDAHCHPQLSDFKDTYLSEWTGHLLVAASTNAQDFFELETLSQSYPCLRVSAGLHPWKISETFPKAELFLLEKKIKTRNFPIGEIGLDQSKRYRATITIQREILRHFFILGSEHQRPLVLHCVKAHHEILSLLKQFPKQKIFLHGFHGSLEVIHQYLRYDCYFGISAKKFQPEAYNLPNHRIFLESDDLMSLVQFQIAYEELAKIKNCNHSQMETQIERNYQSFFECNELKINSQR